MMKVNEMKEKIESLEIKIRQLTERL